MIDDFFALLGNARMAFKWDIVRSSKKDKPVLLLDKDKSIVYSDRYNYSIREKPHILSILSRDNVKVNFENGIHNKISIRNKHVPSVVSSIWYDTRNFKHFTAYGTVVSGKEELNECYKVEVFNKRNGKKLLNLNSDENNLLFLNNKGVYKVKINKDKITVTVYNLTGERIQAKNIVLNIKNKGTKAITINGNKLLIAVYVYNGDINKYWDWNKAGVELYVINSNGNVEKESLNTNMHVDMYTTPLPLLFFHGKEYDNIYSVENTENSFFKKFNKIFTLKFTRVWDPNSRKFVPLLITRFYKQLVQNSYKGISSRVLMLSNQKVNIKKLVFRTSEERLVYHHKRIHVTELHNKNGHVYFNVYNNDNLEHTIDVGELDDDGSSDDYYHRYNITSVGKKGKNLYIIYIGEKSEKVKKGSTPWYRIVNILKYNIKTHEVSIKKVRFKKDRGNNTRYNMFDFIPHHYKYSAKHITKSIIYLMSHKNIAIFKMKAYSDNVFKIGNFLLVYDSINKKFDISPSFAVKNGHFAMVHNSVIENKIHNLDVIFDSQVVTGDIKTGKMNELPMELDSDKSGYVNGTIHSVYYSVIPNILGEDANRYAFIAGTHVKNGAVEKEPNTYTGYKYMKDAFLYKIDLKTLKTQKLFKLDYNTAKKVFTTTTILERNSRINPFAKMLLNTNYRFISYNIFDTHKYQNYIYGKDGNICMVRKNLDKPMSGWLRWNTVDMVIARKKALVFKDTLFVRNLSVIRSFLKDPSIEQDKNNNMER